MRPPGTVVMVLLLVLPASAAAQSADQTPIHFSELFKTLGYRGLTALEQQALIGRRYWGEYWILSTERDPKGAIRLNCRVNVHNTEHELLWAGMATFEIDPEQGAVLKRGYKVRLTGRLARIFKPDPLDVRGLTEFVDVTVDDVIVPPEP